LGRLSAVDREALPENQRRFHDAVKAIRRRPISGPFIVTMNSSPDLAARFAQLGHYFHARGQADESILPLRVRCFVALLGSRALDGVYEWSAWLNWALESGVPQDTVDAIREGRTPQNLTPEESLVSKYFTELISGNHRVSEATHKAALDHFGVQGLVELVATLGYFAMIALPLNAFEIEMSADQMSMRKPFAPLRIRGGTGTRPPSGERDLPPISGKRPAQPRLPAILKHEDLASGHQHFFDRIVRTRGWISGVFQVLLHSPDMAERMAYVGGFFLDGTILPPAVKALTGLIVARELDSDYVWHASADIARRAGIDGKLIDALEKGAAVAGLSREQDALFEFCYQLLRGNHHVTDATYESVISHFGAPIAVQVAAVLGYNVMMALAANAFDVAPDGDVTRPAL
jgi:4-carboxymuconolactone decarboxylase